MEKEQQQRSIQPTGAPPALSAAVSESAYPAHMRTANGNVDGEPTEVSVHQFADKILVTITQRGRLAQWISVPLDPAGPTRGEHYVPSGEEDALPLTHLTPRTLLGAPGTDRETAAHLYATQIASAIATKDPDEERTVLVGLGLVKSQPSREQFFDLVELVLRCL